MMPPKFSKLQHRLSKVNPRFNFWLKTMLPFSQEIHYQLAQGFTIIPMFCIVGLFVEPVFFFF